MRFAKVRLTSGDVGVVRIDESGFAVPIDFSRTKSVRCLAELLASIPIDSALLIKEITY